MCAVLCVVVQGEWLKATANREVLSLSFSRIVAQVSYEPAK